MRSLSLFNITTLLTLFLGTSFLPMHAEEAEKVQMKQFHLVRDVMQPLGMPLVTSFHNIRENEFLNMHMQHAKGLEALGDFFLAPSRYLFAGKTVKPLKEGPLPFELEQSFHYHKMHWLKTTLSLAVLPVSELIGATLKGLSYLSPQVRRKHRKSALP